MKKIMKTGILAAVLTLFCAAMFSGCELIGLFQLGNALADWNYVYVKNNTSSAITLVLDEDADEISEGAKEQDTSITIAAGKTKEKAFTAGYFKIKAGDKAVLPADSNTTPNSNGYYLIYAHSLITITESDGNLIYTIASRQD